MVPDPDLIPGGRSFADISSPRSPPDINKILESFRDPSWRPQGSCSMGETTVDYYSADGVHLWLRSRAIAAAKAGGSIPPLHGYFVGAFGLAAVSHPETVFDVQDMKSKHLQPIYPSYCLRCMPWTCRTCRLDCRHLE